MAKAVTERFDEMTLEVEFDPIGAPGVYSRICGIIDAEVTRTSNIDTDETPDCDDESLPLEVDKAVRSLDVSVSGTGKLARSSQGRLKDWYYSGQPLNIRVRDAFAAPGDTEAETGPALLATLGTGRTKGQTVSLEIEIQFAGTPTRIAA